jgi:hypothetical protein
MSIELTMQILHLVLRFPVHFPCKCILEIKHVDHLLIIYEILI